MSEKSIEVAFIVLKLKSITHLQSRPLWMVR